MGDRVAVIRKGELQQVDTPQRLYEHPVNLFVAGFIGSPAMNLLEARLNPRDGDGTPSSADFGSPSPRRSSAGALTSAVRRPHHRAGHPARGHGGRPPGVRCAAGAAPHRDVSCARRWAPTSACTSPSTLRSRLTDDVSELAVDVGAEALEHVERRRPAVQRPRPPQPADDGSARAAIELVVDTHRLHFFDPEDGTPASTETRRDTNSTQGEEADETYRKIAVAALALVAAACG